MSDGQESCRRIVLAECRNQLATRLLVVDQRAASEKETYCPFENVFEGCEQHVEELIYTISQDRVQKRSSITYIVDRSADHLARMVFTKEQVAGITVGMVGDGKDDMLIRSIELAFDHSVDKLGPLVNACVASQLESDVDETERGGWNEIPQSVF